MKKLAICLCSIGLLLSFSAFTPVNKGAAIENSNVQSVETEVFNLVNKYRKTKGLKPLKLLNAITNEAEKHSENMAAKKVGFGHAGFDDRFSRLQNSIPRLSSGAENVAYGNTSVTQIVNGWIKSPGHRKNMEGNYALTGIGVAKDKQGRLFYTQIFVQQRSK